MIKCEVCGNKWYESLAGECPKKPGHFICMYCCRKCKYSYEYSVGGVRVGYRCRAFDEKKEKREQEAKKKEKSKDAN